LDPSRRSGKPASNRLSYGTAILGVAVMWNEEPMLTLSRQITQAKETPTKAFLNYESLGNFCELYFSVFSRLTYFFVEI
jgi:hypothetical protein